MIFKRNSHIVLLGQVDDDLVSRIHERVLHSLQQYKIFYDDDSIMISWNDDLSPVDYSNLTEDISSLFTSVNIPA